MKVVIAVAAFIYLSIYLSTSYFHRLVCSKLKSPLAACRPTAPAPEPALHCRDFGCRHDAGLLGHTRNKSQPRNKAQHKLQLTTVPRLPYCADPRARPGPKSKRDMTYSRRRRSCRILGYRGGGAMDKCRTFLPSRLLLHGRSLLRRGPCGPRKSTPDPR